MWIDPEAKGDDSVWATACDRHDTFTADHEPNMDRPEDRPNVAVHRTISRTSTRMRAKKEARKKAMLGSEKMSQGIEQNTMTSDHILDLYQRAQKETDPEARHRLMAQVRSMSSQLESAAKLAMDIVNSLLEGDAETCCNDYGTCQCS